MPYAKSVEVRVNKMIAHLEEKLAKKRGTRKPRVVAALVKSFSAGRQENAMKGYLARVSQIYEEQGGLEHDDFVEYAERHSDLAPTSIQTLKSALAKVREAYGISLSVEDDKSLNLYCTGQYGLRLQGEAAKKTTHRGAMTPEMLDQLMGEMMKHNEFDGALAAYFTYHATLRPQDIDCAMTMMIGNVGKHWYYMAKRKANQREVYVNGRFHAHAVTDPTMVKHMKLLKKTKRPHEKLFGAFKAKDGAKWVKRAAAKFKWPTHCQWNGFHTIRHGRGQELVAEACIEAGKKSMAWSGSSARTYSGCGMNHPLNAYWRQQAAIGEPF